MLAGVQMQELMELAALDSGLFCTTFFPSAFRQSSPPFHADLWSVLEDRSKRYAAFKVFRGGAKTTLLRAFTAKRISYGSSRTIVLVSEAEARAQESLDWLKMQVEHNKVWSTSFGLEKGDKWTDWIKIRHNYLGIQIAVKAVGLTGQVRGINVDGYRPDLVVVDDPCDDENTATGEQRRKTADLFFGALMNGLAPSSECPDAKMVLLQTVLHPEDLISMCIKDARWAAREYSVFDENGESAWPERFSTRELLGEKQGYIDRNQLMLWLREKEGKIISPESSVFRGEWLKYYDQLPENTVYFMGIDPVPPPSDREIATGLRTKDHEVLAVIGIKGQDRFLADISASKGHTPEWTITEFFRLVDKWKPLRVRVEAVNYQRTLKWLLEKEMAKRGRYVQVNAPSDKRKKLHRISQAYSGIASNGRFFVHNSQSPFIEQFVSYPNGAHDDMLDAGAMALDEAGETYDWGQGNDAAPWMQDTTDPLRNWMAAP